MTDTIVALATPPGEGGIAIVRLSGTECIELARCVTGDKIDLCVNNPRMMNVIALVDLKWEPLDQALVVFFKAPNSYTGEDTIEFHCHGGEFLSGRLIESLVHSGARRAEPGEFTMRAFLNGRIDLTEAEGILALITSTTSVTHSRAMNLLKGGLKERLENIISKLIEHLAMFEVLIDHPEDDISQTDKNADLNALRALREEIIELSSGYYETKDLDSGLKIAIVGRPNVGKSSLMNRILMRHRVLVHDTPGTTRDVVSEDLILGESRFRIHDTAGLRENADDVEKAGIELAREALKQSDIAIVVFDLSSPLTDEDFATIKAVESKNVLIALNKSDIEHAWNVLDYPNLFANRITINVSAKTGDGIEDLLSYLKSIYMKDSSQIKSATPILKRHFNHLVRASEALSRAENAIQNRFADDAVAIDLRNALEEILRITGESYDDTLLEEIFSKFCLGK